jgi:hypothetical protein
MEILLWLVPPFVCAVMAMIWVAWVSRDGRGEVDADERVRLLGAALEREPASLTRVAASERERSTGVAVRRVGSE